MTRTGGGNLHRERKYTRKVKKEEWRFSHSKGSKAELGSLSNAKLTTTSLKINVNSLAHAGKTAEPL